MPTVHLNIGSNSGDRRENIIRGVDALRRLLAVSADPEAAGTLRISDFVESDPWGFDSPNRFLNAGINIFTTLEPLELLDIVMQAQNSVSDAPHRSPDGMAYIDRAIDIDMIFYGTLRLSHPRLILPHPRASVRDFVMIPLLQLNPGYPVEFLAPSPT